MTRKAPSVRRRLTHLSGGVVAVGATLLMSTAAPASAEETLATDNYRAPAPALGNDNTVYEYAPSIMAENGVYRMWYCAGLEGGVIAGDDIMYAESTSAAGPYTGPGGGAPVRVFEGRGDGSFDGQHVCDPSVVKGGDGAYYMYYGAAIDDGETTMGVARSADGLAWERLGSGPIITPANQQDTGNDYGAGQPSAIFLDGQFYLIFTDTTGAGALPENGAGQFMWRSADPTFGSGVEVFTADGWQPHTPENSRSFMVANAFSADWQYSDELESFIIAHHNDQPFTTLTTLDRNDPRVRPYAPVNVEGAWVEGPGIVSGPDKHALDDGNAECGRVPIELIYSSGTNDVGNPDDLTSKGIHIVAPDAPCSTPSPTPTPTEPTEPPEPTETPTPTDSPEPTETPEPTDEPTQTPEPTDEPTEEPTPTEKPSDEPTEEPTPSPSPTDELPDTGADPALLALVGAGLVTAAAVTLSRRPGRHEA